MEKLIYLVINNWDTIGLIVTNIVALFMKPPFRKRKIEEYDDVETY